MKIKTIDIDVKEWFDRLNGNSYFTAIITINYGMKTAKQIKLPFQYGYGSHAVDMASKKLEKLKLIKLKEYQAFWNYCNDNKIILRHNKIENCLKRDVLSFIS